MKWILSLFLVTWISDVTLGNFTFTYNMAQHCKEHLCRLGYKYETYYRVDAEDRRIYKSDGDIAFEMHLAVLAASNGHILLSSVPNPDASDPVYEIVVGGGGNKFTELRRNLRRNARASAKTVGILSTIEFRAFYIKISVDGLVEFGREGETLPIISYNDVNPLTVRYFSFAAWNGVEAKFLYDCPLPGDNSTATPNSEAVEPKLSNTNQLRRTLLMGRDPSMAPASEVTLSVGLQITSVSYNVFESNLSTGVSIVMKWMDNSLAWNPNKFNGTSMVSFRQGQIWTPSLFVYNSDDTNMKFRTSELITVVNSGEATLHEQTVINSWCFDYRDTISKWPHDLYNCVLLIEPLQIHEKILFKLLSANSQEMKDFADMQEVVYNAWEVNVMQYIIKAGIWEDVNKGNNITYKSDRIVVDMVLKHQATVFNIVLYTPLIVLVVFVLMSFWTEPLKLERVWFYASCIIAMSMGLCYIDYLVPCHSVPSILVLYITVLGGMLLALLIQVSLMTSLAESICKTVTVHNILKHQLLRTLFGLPKLKICHTYETINEVQSQEDVSGFAQDSNHDVEEMQADNTKYEEKLEVAEIFDKAMFFIYSVTFAIMLAFHF